MQVVRTRRLLIASLGAMCLATGLGCGFRDRPVIGFALSQSFLDAARLAMADAEAAGELPEVDTVLLAESSSEAGPALELAGRLVATRGMVAVVGHSNSAASLAAAPVYGSGRIVQVAPTSTAALYSSAGPYSFRMVPPDDAQGAALARVLRERFPRGGRVALFWVNDDYGRGLRAAVKSALAGTGINWVLDLPHVESELRDDIRADAIAAAAAGRPQLVLWLARASVLRDYLPGLRSDLPGVPILAGDAVASWALYPNLDGRWTGVQYIDFVDVGGSERLRAFGERYAARFGTKASGADVLTYDAVRLLLAAVRSGARTGTDVQRYLDRLGRDLPPHEGLAGPISFTDDGDAVRLPQLLTAQGAGRP